MQSNRGKDTSLELAVRREMFRLGLRYFIHRRPITTLRCQADVVFPRVRVAVFIDGCFWHGCPIHGTRPALHREWWAEKLDGNIERDHEHNRLLLAAGWCVMRFWEHEKPIEIADRVLLVVRSAS